MSTPLAAYGPGVLILTRTDTTTPLSVNVGYANEFSIELAGSTKSLFGQYQFPLVAARGTVKATGKIKAAVLSGLAWNSFFFGASFSAGGDQYYLPEAHTVASSTQQVNNHTNGIVDLGVSYQSNGLPLQRVAAGSEAAGKYSVASSTGTYSFAVGDEVALNFNYSNFSSTAAGQQLNVTNQLIGSNPTFQLDYWTNLNQPAAKPFSVRVFGGIADKLALAAKLEDFIMPEFDFSIFADNSGRIMNFNFPEIS
jgi:hypothetical protein